MHHLAENAVDCINQLLIENLACSLEGDCAVMLVVLWAQSFGDYNVLQVVLQFVLKKISRGLDANLACVNGDATDSDALKAEVCLNVLHNV